MVKKDVYIWDILEKVLNLLGLTYVIHLHFKI